MSTSGHNADHLSQPALYEAVLSSIDEEVMFIDAGFVIRWVNRAQLARLDKPLDQVVGCHCYDFWYTRNEPCPECEISQVISSGCERRWNHLDGELLYPVRGVPVTNPDGAVSGVLRICSQPGTDLTSQEHLATYFSQLQNLVSKCSSELQHSEENFRKAFQFNPSLLTITNILTGELYEANDSFCSVTGYSRDELRGKSTLDINLWYDPADRDCLLKTLLSDGSVINQEVNIRTKSGALRIVNFSATLIRFNDTDCILTGAHDITSHKHAEQELLRSRERLQAVYAHLPVPTFTYKKYNDSFVLVDYNNAANQLTGGVLASLLNRPLEEVTPDAALYRDFMNQCLSSHTASSREVVHTFSATGEKRWLSCIYAFVPPDFIVIHSEDITERKHAEKKLLSYQQKLQELTARLTLSEDQERRRIAQTLHDGLCQTLALAKIKLDGAVCSAADPALQAELETVDALLNDAVTASRNLTVELSPPVLYELGYLAAVEWLAGSITQKHGLPVAVRSSGEPPPMAEHSKVILYLVTRELLMNVLKHAQASHVVVSCESTPLSFRISVQDNGVGLPLDRKSSCRGSRFGLFSVKERLNFLGGSLALSSEPGCSTTGVITVPLDALQRQPVDDL